MRGVVVCLFWLCVVAFGFSQDTLRVGIESALRTKTLIIDLGFNNFYNHYSSELDLKTTGSRGVNVYLFNKLNPDSEHIQFRIGFGVGLDNYSFKQDISPQSQVDSTVFVKGNSVDNDSIDFVKSKMSLNHFDIPVEVVFQSKNKAGALKVALGMRVGWLFDVHTKRVTEINGSRVTEKMKSDFNVQKMRYGLTARVMYSGFNFFFMYNLSPLFQKDRGPELSSFMMGISVLID